MRAGKTAPQYKHTRYACYVAYVIQAVVNNLLPLLFMVLRADYGLSYERLGSLILFNFVTQLVVDVLAVSHADKVGHRAAMVLAHICCAAGLLLLAAAPLLPVPIYGALASAVVVYAVGGGLLEVLVSPIADSLPAGEDRRGANMALLHSFYCWGQVAVVALSAFFLLAIGQGRWQALPAVWALLPLCNAFLFARVPLMPSVPESERTPLHRMFRTPAFLAAILLMVCAGASELTVSQWASLFAEQGLGLSKFWGDLAGPCLFAVLMGLGRVVYGVRGTRIRLIRYMALLAGLCAACYLAVSLSPRPAFSLAACALCGFSVSIMWPGALSLSAARFPLGGTAMFGILAMSGDIGCSLGPWLAGLIAGRASVSGSLFHAAAGALFSGDGAPLKTGILFGAVFPALLLLALPAFRPGRRDARAE